MWCCCSLLMLPALWFFRRWLSRPALGPESLLPPAVVC